MTGSHGGAHSGPHQRLHDARPHLRPDHRPEHRVESHHEPPLASPSRPPAPRRPIAWRVGTTLVTAVCGGLLIVSGLDSGGTDLRPGRYTDLASLVEAEADDYEELREEAVALDREVDELAEGVQTGGLSRFRGEIEELEDPAGLTPRSGPGLTITLSDAPDDVFEAALDRVLSGEEINLNTYVVHQQDIQAVVNALWVGGASAVTIAGQRVITTTGIKCESNAVQLQGVPYPAPYVIQAVGDQGDLLEAIERDPLVTGYRIDAQNPEIGIGWELQLEEEVEAPAYDGLLDFRYAEPIR